MSYGSCDYCGKKFRWFTSPIKLVIDTMGYGGKYTISLCDRCKEIFDREINSLVKRWWKL